MTTETTPISPASLQTPAAASRDSQLRDAPNLGSVSLARRALLVGLAPGARAHAAPRPCAPAARVSSGAPRSPRLATVALSPVRPGGQESAGESYRAGSVGLGVGVGAKLGLHPAPRTPAAFRLLDVLAKAVAAALTVAAQEGAGAFNPALGEERMDQRTEERTRVS